jgi:putative DNA primase/helicase
LSDGPDQLRTDGATAWGFLKALWPDTSELILRIPPTGGNPEARRYTRDEGDRFREELPDFNAGHDVYFSINLPRRAMSKKPKKPDIGTIRAVFVDIDPNKSKPLEEERARIASATTDEALAALGLPPPTVRVDSGGGVWLYWVLAESITVAQGDEEAIRKVEGIGRRIASMIGGDSCFNVDRIARLPGTINRASLNPRKAGRPDTLAGVGFMDEARRYRLEDLPEPMLEGSCAAKPADIDPEDAEPDTNADADALPTEELRRVARDGMDKAKPSRWHADGILDRSRALHWFLCECIRRAVPFQTAAGIVTSPRFKIADSVRETSDPVKTARDQWTKAVAKVGDKAGSKAEHKPPPEGSICERDGHLNAAIVAYESALTEADEPIFARGKELMRPIRHGDGARRPGAVRRPDAAIVLQPVSASWLVQRGEATGKFVRRDRQGNFNPATPTLSLAAHLLARAGDWPWRELTAIVNRPTMIDADGAILAEPGYHESSGILYDPLGVEFPPIPDSPSKEDGAAALEEFHAIYEKMDFVPSDAEEAAGAPWHRTAAFSSVLATTLSILARPALPNVPALVVNAPVWGSAKTKCADSIAISTTGREPAAVAFTANVREFDQLFYVVVREGDPVTLIDNVSVPLGGSDPLNQALTKPMIQYRVLGESQRHEVRNTTVVIATGINVQVEHDTARRVIEARLDPRCEKPEERRFDFDPVHRARERWPRLVVAGITALRAFVQAGCPQPVPSMRPLGSYEAWDRLIRACLIWYGYADPADSRLRIAEDDATRDAHADLLKVWWGTMGREPVTVGDIAERGIEDPLYRAVMEFTGNPAWNARSIGRRLRGIRNRIVGGLVLRRLNTDGDDNLRWRVEAVTGKAAEEAEAVAQLALGYGVGAGFAGRAGSFITGEGGGTT